MLATTVHTAPDGAGAGEPPAVQARPAPDRRRSCPRTAPCCSTSTSPRAQAPDDDPERSAEKIRESLGTLPAPLDRVAVAVRRAGADERSSWFTFRPDARTGEPVEDRTLRGLHPMVAERLGVWRLANFDAHPAARRRRRAPVPRRRAATCPTTSGSSSLSDVRDLSVVRDEPGHIRALPQLEHVLDACLDALRAARRGRPRPTRALDWNRVLLYVWPVVDVALDELGRSSAGWRRAPRRWAWSRCSCSSGDAGARAGATEPQELLLRLSRPPGAGLTRAGHRSRRPGRCASWTPTRRR